MYECITKVPLLSRKAKLAPIHKPLPLVRNQVSRVKKTYKYIYIYIYIYITGTKRAHFLYKKKKTSVLIILDS